VFLSSLSECFFLQKCHNLLCGDPGRSGCLKNLHLPGVPLSNPVVFHPVRQPLDQQALTGIAKGFNRAENYDELMRQLHKAHIVVQGTFVFGFDHDTKDVFADTVERIHELKIDIPRYSIYTPYPGTRLFQRLEEEVRILSYDWGDYDTMHVVFRPQHMSPVELYEGFRWAYRETFRLNSILRRTIASGMNFPIAFVGNLTYKIFVKRLYRQKAFEMPVTARGVHQVAERSAARQSHTNVGNLHP